MSRNAPSAQHATSSKQDGHILGGEDRLVEEHQTKGGLNERVRATLLAKGWFDVPAAVLKETTTLSYKKLG